MLHVCYLKSLWALFDFSLDNNLPLEVSVGYMEDLRILITNTRLNF